jgi:ATP-dependent Clp protease adaptor protein ClpS
MPRTTQKPVIEAGAAVTSLHEDMCQVILHNDDHNTMEFVVDCLRKVFAHPTELAVKITLEAHQKGKAIAEVESETPARLHKDQLQSFGLTAELERI